MLEELEKDDVFENLSPKVRKNSAENIIDEHFDTVNSFRVRK